MNFLSFRLFNSHFSFLKLKLSFTGDQTWGGILDDQYL